MSGVGPLLGSGFWLIATERFDPHTAKKRFGQIAGAGTVGGLIGGLVAERVDPPPLPQRMTMALARAGATFEEKNPIAQLMADRERGVIQADILDEKVLSAIVEMKTSVSQAEHFIDIIEQVAPTRDTVVASGVSAVCDAEGRNQIEEIMVQRGYRIIRGKTNLGLGRATNPIAQAVETRVAV